MGNMYKTELIKRVAKETRLSQRAVGDVVNASQQVIADTLKVGKAVQFPGFGTFYTRQRQASKVRDVRTGKELAVAARRVAAFRVGEVLKRAVRSGRRARKQG